MARNQMTVRDLFKRFPTEEACLEHVMEVRHGLRHVCTKCKQEATFHRLADRPAYSCAKCGAHVHPLADTIFRDTRTPLQVWFYAIYLFVVTRHGVSGKELERQLGVTYKTAYRMGQQIRTLMGGVNNFEKLRGHIEIDEAWVGGRNKPKTIVVGMKERGGRMKMEVAPDVTRNSLRLIALRNIETGSTVSTDEHLGYRLLTPDGYQHFTVKHRAKEYARYTEDGTMVSVNGVESFWNLFKNSVRSTHIHVSSKRIEKYLGEFTFRSNHRDMKNAMFDLLLAAI